MVKLELERAELLTKVLQHPKKGVEFGTRAGLTSHILLSAFPALDLITVDNYLAMPWLTGIHSQTEKHEHFDQAITVLNEFTDRCVLWEIEARAAAMILRGYDADFVYVDISYRSEWSRKHLPMFTEIVRKGGILCGGGWQKYKLRVCLLEMFPGVQGEKSLWWKII